MMEKCHVCSRPGEEQCEHCENISTEQGLIEIFFNGYLAKSLSVCQCHVCDGVWLESTAGERIFICSKCAHKALRVVPRDPEQLAKAS
jgi:hypothetical protein